MSINKKSIRYDFREGVFNRDGWKCKFCDSNQDLDAHHITDRNLMPNGGYVKENGITLCPVHHIIAEEGTEDYVQPDKLYELIGSSYTKAYWASEKLGEK